MSGIRLYLTKVVRGVFHRGETFAVEGGISFGPGSDPKGSFYTDPRVSVYWYQPESVVLLDEQEKSAGLFKGLFMKLGGVRLSA